MTLNTQDTAMLKRIALASLLLAMTSQADPIRLSKPVAQDETTETFGAVFEKNGEGLTLSQVMATPEQYQNEEFLLRTEIAKVCQKKGCFFIGRQSGLAVRIAFKDYGFFIPTDSGGKTVLLKGHLVAKNMSEAQATHFNKDLGGENLFAKGPTYEIIASGIVIPKA